MVLLAAAEAAAAPPWWGASMIAGIFTFVGVVLAQASGYLVDKRRVKREDTTRWDTDLREMCARFASQLDLFHEVQRNWHLGKNTIATTLEVEAVLTELDFIASESIYRAAHSVYEAGVSCMLRAPRSKPGGERAEEFVDAYQIFCYRQLEYIKAVRAHFWSSRLEIYDALLACYSR